MIDQSWLQAKSPTEVEVILAQLRSWLEGVYGQRLRGLYLYGSYARGEAAPGSDLDVLLVLDRVHSYWREIDGSGHIASELSLQHDLTISRAFVSEEQWQRAEIPHLSHVGETYDPEFLDLLEGDRRRHRRLPAQQRAIHPRFS